MAWLELHQTMPRHRKTLLLAKFLKVSRREAAGILVDLWCWALDNADKGGILSDMDAGDIAVALGFERKKGDWLVAGLTQSGYLEREEELFRLHDWYDYAGKLFEEREKNRERMRKSRRERANAGPDISGF